MGYASVRRVCVAPAQELVYDANEWNPHLPGTIEAFFVTKTDRVHDSAPTVDRHRSFLQHYRLSAEDVPLLTFDPTNWESPFDRFLPAHASSSQGRVSPCPDWCKTWHCDGAQWCRRGAIPAPCQNCKKA